MDDKLKGNQVSTSNNNKTNITHSQEDIEVTEVNTKEVEQDQKFTNNRFKKPLALILPISLLIFLFTPPGANLLKNISSLRAKQGKESNTIITEQKQILTVQTQQVQPVNSYSVKRFYNGTVVPRRITHVGFERSGKLETIAVDEGDKVKAGKILAFLDTKTLKAQQRELLAQRAQLVAQLKELQAGARSQTIAAAKANVNKLKSQLQLARIKNQRRKNLYQQGAISQEQFDETTSSLNSKQANLEESQSKLNELLAGTRPEKIEAQKASIEQLDAKIASLEIELEKSILKAPFTGTIAANLVDEGAVIPMGNPVFRLVENGILEAHVGVPVAVANKLKSGKTLPVEIGEKNYSARVISKLPELDPSTLTATVVLNLNSEAIGKVTSGQIVRLQMNETVSDTGYWLPTTALVKGVRGLFSCYVLGEAEKSEYFRVERKDVEIIHNIGDRVLVRGTLLPGDRVIANGTHRVVPGMLVKPKLR
ncbi:MAG: efflux RND transporter periplasmic adaptor subunit [Rivularia sp. (in: cyanobacteria)]